LTDSYADYLTKRSYWYKIELGWIINVLKGKVL